MSGTTGRVYGRPDRGGFGVDLTSATGGRVVWSVAGLARGTDVELAAALDVLAARGDLVQVTGADGLPADLLVPGAPRAAFLSDPAARSPQAAADLASAGYAVSQPGDAAPVVLLRP